MNRIPSDLSRQIFYYSEFSELLNLRLVAKDWSRSIFHPNFFFDWFSTLAQCSLNASFYESQRVECWNDWELRKMQKEFFKVLVMNYLKVLSASKKNRHSIGKIQRLLNQFLGCLSLDSKKIDALFSDFSKEIRYNPIKNRIESVRGSIFQSDHWQENLELLKQITQSTFVRSIRLFSLRINFIHAVVELLTQREDLFNVMQQFLSSYIGSWSAFESIETFSGSNPTTKNISPRIDLYLYRMKDFPVIIDHQNFLSLKTKFVLFYKKRPESSLLFSLLIFQCHFLEESDRKIMDQNCFFALKEISVDLLIFNRTKLFLLKKKLPEMMREGLSNRAMLGKFLIVFFHHAYFDQLLMCLSYLFSSFVVGIDFSLRTKHYEKSSVPLVVEFFSVFILSVVSIASFSYFRLSHERYAKLKDLVDLIDRFPDRIEI